MRHLTQRTGGVVVIGHTGAPRSIGSRAAAMGSIAGPALQCRKPKRCKGPKGRKRHVMQPMQTVPDALIVSWPQPLRHGLGLPAPARSLLGRSSARSSLKAHNQDRLHRRCCAPSSVP
jgi:hypothetical protein